MVLRIVSWAVLSFLGLPMALIIVMSFNSVANLVFPPQGLSLKWYANVFHTDQFILGLAQSAYLAVASSALGLVIGTAAAYAIVRFRFYGRNLLNALIMAPLIVPEVVMGIGLLVWISSLRLGVQDEGLVLLHCLIVLPYIVRIIAANLQRIDRNLEDAAMLLGAHPAAAFLRVTLPTIRKGVVAALIFALVISFQNFTATIFLVTTRPTLPLTIFAYIRTESDPTIAALSTMLVALTALIVWLTDRILGLERLSQ